MNFENTWSLTVPIENYWPNVMLVNTGEPKLSLQVKPQFSENEHQPSLTMVAGPTHFQTVSHYR